MRYCDLRPAIAAYARGDNVTETLRGLLGAAANTPEIIEIAYDLQAGTYVDAVRADEAAWRARMEEMAGILKPVAAGATTILEAGTGEMTSLVGVANACYREDATAYACDLSWSRLEKGRSFVRDRLRPSLAERLEPFVADLFRLPFQDGAIDVVWTSHALEPNGGREREAVRELLRVARRHVVLFEPSYETNTAEGRARMERLGYVRGLAGAIEAEGGIIEGRVALRHVANPLNPTVALIVRPPSRDAAAAGTWSCPSTRLPMERRPACFWSCQSMLAYPILGGIPILRADAAILATAMA